MSTYNMYVCFWALGIKILQHSHPKFREGHIGAQSYTHLPRETHLSVIWSILYSSEGAHRHVLSCSVVSHNSLHTRHTRHFTIHINLTFIHSPLSHSTHTLPTYCKPPIFSLAFNSRSFSVQVMH